MEVAAVPVLVTFSDWDALAPLVIELQPAGHTPGFYFCAFDLINIETPTALGVARRYDYFAPVFGATSAVGVAGTANQPGHAGATSFNVQSFMSSGDGPITLTLTPSGLVGTVRMNVYAAALLGGAP